MPEHLPKTDASRLAHLMQAQVPLSSDVTLTLKTTGRQVSGSLVALGLSHVTIETQPGSTTTLILDEIAMFEVGSTLSPPPTVHLQEPPIILPAIHEATATRMAPEAAQADKEVLRRLAEIEVGYEVHVKTTRLTLMPADFEFPLPEFQGANGPTVLNQLERIHNRYTYALKVNELGAQFGRIQPIAAALRGVAELYPASPSVKRHQGYFYTLLQAYRDAHSSYLAAARVSQRSDDWHNVVVTADALNDPDLAKVALEQVFRNTPLTFNAENWYRYVALLDATSDYALLKGLASRLSRELNDEELAKIFEATLYVLLRTDRRSTAEALLNDHRDAKAVRRILEQALTHIDGTLTPAFESAAQQTLKPLPVAQTTISPRVAEGVIHTYSPEKGYGFINTGNGADHFFHKSAIVDDELINRLAVFSRSYHIAVTFEPAHGARGLAAFKISLPRTVDELVALTETYAGDGEYLKALDVIKRVLSVEPDRPGAKANFDRWHEFARIGGVPRGSNPYARAKRVHLLEKDLDRAAGMYQAAIAAGDNTETAVKDLAVIYIQKGDGASAIQLLQRHRPAMADKQAVDNLLVDAYRKSSPAKFRGRRLAAAYRLRMITYPMALNKRS